MKGVIVLLLLAACTRSKEPLAESSSDAGSCGSLGGACSQEGATCTPAPIGSGWSHML